MTLLQRGYSGCAKRNARFAVSQELDEDLVAVEIDELRGHRPLAEFLGQELYISWPTRKVIIAPKLPKTARLTSGEISGTGSYTE